jgi:ATP-binding cassette subfamily F protein uup
VRRVEEMKKARDALKVDKGLFNQTMKKVSLEPLKPALASRVVLEFHKVSKRFEEKGRTKTILDNFNLKILRGDRIGILGKNGSGKTTFLKLLLGELKPDSGKVKLAHTAEVAYFDQKRADLNPKHSLWKTLCPEGGDYVEVGGKPRHVCGYLKNFLFDPKGARDLVETLSGGQRNRLMLAKVLANPGNFMILDEPTNDLDMDTLEMLEEILSHYKGTLFIVSHDRDFLDQTVTKMLSFEGDGEVNGHIGGYLKVQTGDNVKQGKQSPAKSKTKTTKTKSAAKGLTFTQQHELDKLPKTLEALETEKAALHAIISDPDLYMNEPERFDATSEQIAEVQIQIEAAEQRWLELETLKEQA